MSRLRTARRRHGGRHIDDERGFTLIELVIASGVMALVLASLAYTGTMAFADAALSRNRTVATSLANEAIERVRALPYNTVAIGLGTSDLAAGTDSAATLSAGAYRFGGERIPNGNNATVSPIVPHQVTRVIDHATYTVSVYVTYFNDDPTTRSFRVTANVSWVSPLRAKAQKFVQVQTVIYSPAAGAGGSGGGSGCNSNATCPFTSPQQPFLYGNSEIAEGGITISGYTAGGTSISGINLDEASMWMPTESSNMAIEQVEVTSSAARTSGVTMRQTGQSDTVSGRQTVNVGSDSDPSQPKPVYATASTPAQAASSLSMSGGSNSLTMGSSGGDTATATATVLSTVTNACANAASPAVNQLDSLPCGNATTLQGGSMSAVLALNGLGSATLASVGGGGTSAAHTNRDVTPQPASCTSTSGTGCLQSIHRSAIGSVRIGGLPSALAAVAPAGFDYLLKLDNFTRTVKAEAGIGNANPSVVSSGTIQYWTGAGYSSLAVGSGASAPIPLTTVTATSGSTTATLQIGASLRTGATA
ncbi:MAG: hypothetical protein QOI47_1548, partial [Actinomycetota bacterium]|nr:hypothetical protein [Actinomycetota bacterium]